MLSGYIWTEFVALHHHELEISGQALLKLPYFIVDLNRETIVHILLKARNFVEMFIIV